MELNVLYALIYATRNSSHEKYPYIILIGRGGGHGKNCFLQYHSSNYFGICFGDRALSNMIAKEWKPWTKPELRHNIQRIKGFEDVSRADR